MSTYLPGVTDTGFNPVQYSPNFPYMMNALQKATARYETNFEKMSQGYQNIMEAPIINKDVSNKRDQYLTQIKDQLKTISTTDLSIQSNVNAAENLYAPFWEDKEMLAHIKDSKARMSAYEKQKALALENPRSDNATAATVHEYYMQQIQNSKDPTIIDKTPAVKAVNMRNNPIEFNEWLKTQNYSIVGSRAEGALIYKTENGVLTKDTYDNVYRAWLGNSAQDQYDMYGQYYNIQAIQKIKSDKKQQLNIDISDEEALNYLEDHFASEKIKALEADQKRLALNFAAVEGNKEIFKTDRLKTEALLLQAKEIADQMDNNDKQISLFKSKGRKADGTVDENYTTEMNLLKQSPVSFYANIKYNQDADLASAIAANKQSVTITENTAQTHHDQLVQDAAKQQDDILKVRQKAVKDLQGNETQKVTNQVPLAINDQSGNIVRSPVDVFNDMIYSGVQRGLGDMLNIMQTAKTDLISKIIPQNEVAIIKEGLSTGDYAKTNKVVQDAKARLVAAGYPADKIKNINGPVGLITAVVDYYNVDIKSAIDARNAALEQGVYDEANSKKAKDNFDDYNLLLIAQNKLNNLYTLQTQFEQNVISKLADDKYKDVRIETKNGKYELLTLENLKKKYKTIPSYVLNKFFNGQLEEKNINRIMPIAADQKPVPIGQFQKTDNSTDTRQRTKVQYLDPKTNKYIDITDLVSEFKTFNLDAEKVKKGYQNLDNTIPTSLQKLMQESTGMQGTRVVYKSDESKFTDVADMLATDFFPAFNNNVVFEGDKPVLVGDLPKDMTEALYNQGVLAGIISNPAKGLTEVSFSPIGSKNSNRRNVTFKYDLNTLSGYIQDENWKKAFGSSYTGSITFELNDEAVVKGFPQMSKNPTFYDILLSDNRNIVKQNDAENAVGLKYQFYKDGDRIMVKAGYQLILPDPTDPKKVVSKFVDALDETKDYLEGGGFMVLPDNTTIEDYLERLRTSFSVVMEENNYQLQKALKPESLADPSTRAALDNMNQQFDAQRNRVSKYRK